MSKQVWIGAGQRWDLGALREMVSAMHDLPDDTPVDLNHFEGILEAVATVPS